MTKGAPSVRTYPFDLIHIVYSNKAPVMRTYRKSVPPKPGYVVTVWRPDDSLIAFTAGEPEIPTMPQTEAELERQLADAQVRIRR